MIGHRASPGLTFEDGIHAGFRKMLGHVAGFFRSLEWALAFSRRCEDELRNGRVIDQAVLARILADLPGHQRAQE